MKIALIGALVVAGIWLAPVAQGQFEDFLMVNRDFYVTGYSRLHPVPCTAHIGASVNGFTISGCNWDGFWAHFIRATPAQFTELPQANNTSLGILFQTWLVQDYYVSMVGVFCAWSSDAGTQFIYIEVPLNSPDKGTPSLLFGAQVLE